jgi:hypothetical protein
MFRGTCNLHVHDIKVSRVWKESAADANSKTVRIGALMESIGEIRSVK